MRYDTSDEVKADLLNGNLDVVWCVFSQTLSQLLSSSCDISITLTLNLSSSAGALVFFPTATSQRS